MNNKYKPKFYARTQPKLEYVKKTEDRPAPEFIIKPRYPSEEQFADMGRGDIERLVRQLLIKLIKQRLEKAATKLLIVDSPKGDYANWLTADKPGVSA